MYNKRYLPQQVAFNIESFLGAFIHCPRLCYTPINAIVFPRRKKTHLVPYARDDSHRIRVYITRPRRLSQHTHHSFLNSYHEGHECVRPGLVGWHEPSPRRGS